MTFDPPSMKPSHVIGFTLGLMLSFYSVSLGNPHFFTFSNLHRLHESLGSR
jgi:hypothetical protein